MEIRMQQIACFLDCAPHKHAT